MYAKCSITYRGRAESTLELGNYFILHKRDGTLLIHGGLLSKPLNYQPPGAELFVLPDKIISKRKEERIEIDLKKVHFYKELPDWSEFPIKITKTEEELKQKFIRCAPDYFNNIRTIEDEAPIPLGKIDVLIITEDNTYHVIEIKRKKANISACSQLLRYVDYFRLAEFKSIGYLVAPAVSKTVPDYLMKNNLQFIKFDF